MKKHKIFISSVQKEFLQECQAIANFLLEHNLLHDYFEIFIFESQIAMGNSPQKVFFAEIDRCDIYLGLLGCQYGTEVTDGISATELEYNYAGELYKNRWIFIFGSEDESRHEKETAFIDKVGEQVARKRVFCIEEAIKEIERSCFLFLKQKGIIESSLFDNSLHPYADFKQDIDSRKIKDFLLLAKQKRNFPLLEIKSPEEVLEHLALTRDGKICNSALLVFAYHPQKFFPCAIIKCAHFHGNEVSKPIPDLKEFKGTVSEMAEAAVNFVLSKINQRTGDRELSNRVDTSYEIPRSVIAEAIINAVAHRDYLSLASVQVSVFENRVEIFNPGKLPTDLNIEKLKVAHSSYPKNPLLCQCLFNMGEIERYGTGTQDIFDKVAEKGLASPIISLDEGFRLTLWREVVTGQVTGQANTEVDEYKIYTPTEKVILVIKSTMKSSEIQKQLNLSHRETFRDNYLLPAIEDDLIEMTIPEKPKSSNQQYRLTAKGKQLKIKLEKK